MQPWMGYNLGVAKRLWRDARGYPVDLLIPKAVTGKGTEIAVVGLNEPIIVEWTLRIPPECLLKEDVLTLLSKGPQWLPSPPFTPFVPPTTMTNRPVWLPLWIDWLSAHPSHPPPSTQRPES